MNASDEPISYLARPEREGSQKWLVVEGGRQSGQRFAFSRRIEIGRIGKDRPAEGRLLLRDPTVSSRHCVITQETDGRCFVRDVSRNGTRLDGRRLSPNLRTELKIGQVLSVGREFRFRLEGDGPADLVDQQHGIPGTQAVTNPIEVTVLVGDIRAYTRMVQQAPPDILRESVERVFKRLEAKVVQAGGTLKEFQGDAIFAFWEEVEGANHAVEACRAAVRLDAVARELAADREVWKVEDFSLQMDWALATGPVVIQGHGGQHSVGLSMIGAPVVLAFRIEKFAHEGTGSIIVCERTRKTTGGAFVFRSLGRRSVQGFDEHCELFSLVEEASG